jgi:hypothetical protein
MLKDIITDPKIMGGTVLGAFLAHFGAVARDWSKEKKDRKLLASALLVEVYQQCESVSLCGSLANEFTSATIEKFDLLGVNTVKYREFHFTPPVVFPAVVGKITSLPVETAGAVISFYGYLGRAQAVTMETADDSVKMIEVWKNAAIKGIAAIKALEASAPAETTGRKAVTDDLIAVSSGQSPHQQVD